MPCPLCGGLLNDVERGSSLCFRCRESGGRVRLEIYDLEGDLKGADCFSDIFLGKTNYRKMRKANLKRGGY